MSEQPPEVPIILEEPDFRRMLAREVQRATRYPDFLSVCLVRLDPPARPDAEISVGIARKLAEMLRGSDVVGMVGQDIAVILVHTPATDAIAITDRMQRALQELVLTASGSGRSPFAVELALVAFPGDATTDEGLLDRARARLPKLS
jgi:hypothetical protein